MFHIASVAAKRAPDRYPCLTGLYLCVNERLSAPVVQAAIAAFPAFDEPRPRCQCALATIKRAPLVGSWFGSQALQGVCQAHPRLNGIAVSATHHPDFTPSPGGRQARAPRPSIVIVTAVPRPGVLSIAIAPPARSTARLAIAKPKPVPAISPR